MQYLLLLLVLAAAAAGSCNAGYISIRSQGLPQGGTLYVMGGQADSQPRMLGVLSRIQLAPMTVQIQGDSAAQAFSSVFSDRRSGLFDSSLSTWMDQQMAALDSLQSMLDSPPNTRMPCPRAAAAAAAAQANVPDVLAYMASSRFGPSVLSSIAQQSMMESQGDVDDSAMYDNMDYSGDDQADELAGFDAGGVGEYTAEAMANDFNSQELYAPAEGEVVLDGRGFYPSMLAEDDTQEEYPASLAPGQIIKKDDGPTWFFVLDDGSINWGFIVFLLLVAAVLSLWFHICRSACRLFRAQRQQQHDSEQFLISARAPLLAPLAPEKPMAETAAPQLFSTIEDASKMIPKGTFFAPKGNEYVTIAYVPLKGEQ